MEASVVFQITLVIALLLLAWVVGKHFGSVSPTAFQDTWLTESKKGFGLPANANGTVTKAPFDVASKPLVATLTPPVYKTPTTTPKASASLAGQTQNTSLESTSTATNGAAVPWTSIAEWDFPGNDLERFGNTTVSACQAACQDRSLCNAVTFDKKLQACFLKTSLSAKTPTFPGNRITLMKPATSAKFQQHLNTDIPGNDLYVVSAPNATACGRLCELNDACTGSTFFADNTARCKLKASSSGTVTSPQRVSYF